VSLYRSTRFFDNRNPKRFHRTRKVRNFDNVPPSVDINVEAESSKNIPSDRKRGVRVLENPESHPEFENSCVATGLILVEESSIWQITGSVTLSRASVLVILKPGGTWFLAIVHASSLVRIPWV
jgi:hypothetical protein